MRERAQKFCSFGRVYCAEQAPAFRLLESSFQSPHRSSARTMDEREASQSPRFRNPRPRFLAGGGRKNGERTAGCGPSIEPAASPSRSVEPRAARRSGWKSRACCSWSWRWSAAAPRCASTIATRQARDPAGRWCWLPAFCAAVRLLWGEFLLEIATAKVSRKRLVAHQSGL